MMNLPANGVVSQADQSRASAAVLKIDALDLLIQQREIRTLESVSDVDSSGPDKGSVGWISFAQQRWPVFCLSPRLDLQLDIPAARGTCVLLVLENGYAGLLCDDVTILKQVSGRLYELPVAMRRRDTPIRGVLSYNQGIACVSDAGRLAAYIAQMAYES